MTARFLPFAALSALAALAPAVASAHPLGNFSISHYAGIRVEPAGVEVRYLIDMAEIPTFQEIHENGVVPEAGDASVGGYLSRRMEALRESLRLEVDGRRLELKTRSTEVIFPPGAGGLPTMKIGVLYRANAGGLAPGGLHQLRYRDANFPDRAGWKEIVAVGGTGIVIETSSVPAKDRSRELADYPADLLNSPPQDLEARVVFAVEGPSPAVSRGGPGTVAPPTTRPDRDGKLPRPTGTPSRRAAGSASAPPSGPSAPPVAEKEAERPTNIGIAPRELDGNRQATPRNAFTELMTKKQLGFGVVLLALGVAVGLGALHALEPGHGKTVVAAYLVGSRGTAWHAFILGLVVTASHTVGVYLLGAVTLYASRYVVPDRLYPWLGAASGLTIAGLGLALFLRRYAGRALDAHGHDHAHEPGVAHTRGAHAHHHHVPGEAVSLRELVALGLTGGIVPCPAALVVLLSAVALRRIGFGLLLIVAFSVGLAAVLTAIGVLMVYAGRMMARFQGDGPLIARWLPLASSAAVTVLGLGIALQALVTAGIVQVRLG